MIKPTGYLNHSFFQSTYFKRDTNFNFFALVRDKFAPAINLAIFF